MTPPGGSSFRPRIPSRLERSAQFCHRLAYCRSRDFEP